VSPTTYKVNVSFATSDQNTTMTVWILKDGTVLAINEAGQNLTGSIAQQIATSIFAGFEAYNSAGAQLSAYTSASYFHSTGTSSVTLGPTTMTVTNYEANTLPVTVTYCTGSTTFTAYALSVGSPPGTNTPLITLEHFAGTSTDNTTGKTSTIDYTLQITSITLA
jgi:hypothetical protein